MVITIRRLDEVPMVPPKRRVLKTGYVQLYWPLGGDVYLACYEHRFVMGLPPAGTVVHHKNGERADNQPGNLEVVESQATHQRRHFPRTFDVEAAERLHRSGLGCKRVARLVGVTACTIRKALKSRGVTMHPHAGGSALAPASRRAAART